MKRSVSSGERNHLAPQLWKFAKALLAGLLLAGLLTSLSACNDYYHHGRYEMKVQGEDVYFSVCERQIVSEVLVQEWHRGSGEPSDETVWRATGEADLREGDVLQAGTDGAGMETVEFVKPSLKPGSKYFLEVQGEVSGTSSALFIIPARGLPEGEWLDSDGTLNETPCTS